MKCPYCQKDMEKGFIQCRDGIHWTANIKLLDSTHEVEVEALPVEGQSALHG